MAIYAGFINLAGYPIHRTLKNFGFPYCRLGLPLLVFLFCSLSLAAQRSATDAALARQYLGEKAYDKALPLFETLYRAAPYDRSIYKDYLDALLGSGKTEAADSLVRYMMQIRRNDPGLLVDLGIVLKAANKPKEARKQFEAALGTISPNDFSTRALASAFEQAGMPEYAIKTYETARERKQLPYDFATELALLYHATGNTLKAIDAQLDMLMTQHAALDDVKTTLAQLTGADHSAAGYLEKSLKQRLKSQPHNPFWKEMIAWTFLQSGDYSGALEQLIALDAANGDGGRSVLDFGEKARLAGQHAIAGRAVSYVAGLGPEAPFHLAASTLRLRLELDVLEAGKRDPDNLQAVLRHFETHFRQYPLERHTELWRAYAGIYARYLNRVDTAIQLLEGLLNEPGLPPALAGHCKLDMGDYQVLKGAVWEATLLYSQVDKAFKEDYLGEEARFRNARLAYYRGDFKLAQEQLAVLKASTSELIANDALYLSVLITENTPADSNYTTLSAFAKADLLLFQHRYREADKLLDSVSTRFPEDALQDDIAFLRAKIAEGVQNWEKALEFLALINSNYSEDILGDDALLKTAEIYRIHLGNPTKALEYYERLILDFPGSIFVQEARKQYNELKTEKPARAGT